MASAIFCRTFLSHRLHSSPRFFFPKPLVSSQPFHTGPVGFSTRGLSHYNLVPKTRLLCCVISSTSVGAKSFCTQAMSTSEPVVSFEWLHSNLKQPGLKVLDASWYMPDEQRNPIQEYQVAHISGALFFDVDGIADRTTNLSHMLPSEEAFAAAISALGIENEVGVVVYDGKGLFSAARVWWMFRVFGHDRVWVLDGGLP